MAATDTAGLCALQLACRKNAYDAVLVLIKNKADTTLVKGGEPPLFYATMAENPALVRALLEAGADIAQPSSSGQSLMEVVNPKCEIYRIIKKHVITRPGGARKLNLMSEESIVATSLSDLPLEILQLVNKAGTYSSSHATAPEFLQRAEGGRYCRKLDRVLQHHSYEYDCPFRILA